MSNPVVPDYPYGSFLTDGEDIVVVTADGHWPILDGGSSYLDTDAMEAEDFEDWELLEPWEIIAFLTESLEHPDGDADSAVIVDEDELD